MHCCTTKFFCRYDFSECGVHKRWSTEKNCSYFVDNNIFLSHCRNISPSSCTTSNHYCQLKQVLSLIIFHTRKSNLLEFCFICFKQPGFLCKIYFLFIAVPEVYLMNLILPHCQMFCHHAPCLEIFQLAKEGKHLHCPLHTHKVI